MKKNYNYFLSQITHADKELASIQARSMEIGYGYAQVEIVKQNKYVQLFNPRAKYWVKVEVGTGKIISHRKTPYKGIVVK